MTGPTEPISAFNDPECDLAGGDTFGTPFPQQWPQQSTVDSDHHGRTAGPTSALLIQRPGHEGPELCPRQLHSARSTTGKHAARQALQMQLEH